MNFSNVISFAYVMLLYVLPAMLTLVIVLWLKDWVVRVITRWKRASIAKYRLMQEDRWFVVLEVMKIAMFIVMLMPLVVIVSYATNEDAADPGLSILTEVMPEVFIVITLWHLLAIVIFGIYWRSKKDKEEEQERMDQSRALGGQEG